MITATTNGVKISVETFYQSKYSRPNLSEYVFAYRITIENKTDETIQLMRRQWFIFDSNGEHSEVTGEGVIGKQPTLEPDELHQYVSGCHLKSEIGRMKGSYEFINKSDGSSFEVEIPEFKLVAPLKLN